MGRAEISARARATKQAICAFLALKERGGEGVKRKLANEHTALPERRLRIAGAAAGLVMLSASCVPAGGVESLARLAPPSGSVEILLPPAIPALAAIPTDSSIVGPDALVGDGALLANAAIPLSDLANPGARPFVIRARTGLDQMRSLNCLAEAVYYEAASESEEGQRAVAQVVLNRVRHPSWPNSVCGVVYQGPMRPGGGCQFTFTCDGSLAVRPGGASWLRARRIATEALAGSTFAPVGHSTHYHTNYVLPAWAPRLAKTTMIGAHIFYRLPGRWGAPGSFTAAYAGREPLPRPVLLFPRRAALPALAASLPDFAPVLPVASAERPRLPLAAPVDEPSRGRSGDPLLPESRIREEYRHSGMWRVDSPVPPAR